MLTWIILRAGGIAAYLMLWATVSWGLIGTTSLMGKRVSRATAIAVHQFLATAAFLLLGVHIGGLLVDTFVHFAPLDVAVPLHSVYKTIPVAFGVVAMYALGVVVLSSWARKHLSTKLWRALHLLAVPTFAMALVHGVFTGTDTVRSWMWWGYVGTGASVLFLMLTRALTVGLRPERHAVPAGVAPRTPVGRPAASPAARPATVPARAARTPAVGRPTAVLPRRVAAETPERSVAGEPSPPTVVVRLELVIDGESIRAIRHIDVPVRVEPSLVERFVPPAPSGNGNHHAPGEWDPPP